MKVQTLRLEDIWHQISSIYKFLKMACSIRVAFFDYCGKITISFANKKLPSVRTCDCVKVHDKGIKVTGGIKVDNHLI